MHPALNRHSFALAASLLALLPLAACGGKQKPAVEPPAAATPATPATPVDPIPPPKGWVPKGPGVPQLPSIAPKADSDKKAKKGYTPMCADGVVKDDGQLETGYGYVPNAKWGLYLQEFSSDQFASTELDHVCVCWLRKRDDVDIDYEVVFYEKKEGKPVETPYATRPGIAKDVPKGRDSGGRFYDVDVSGVKIPEGTSYIGVRWDPSANPYFFVCADHSPESMVTAGYQREDRAPGWLPILGSRDPIFLRHKAMMLRVTPKPAAADKAGKKDGKKGD